MTVHLLPRMTTCDKCGKPIRPQSIIYIDHSACSRVRQAENAEKNAAMPAQRIKALTYKRPYKDAFIDFIVRNAD